MAEHAIKLTSEMIDAILGHEKTQTRRLVKPQPTNGEQPPLKYQIGDILWIESTDVWLEVTAIRMERLNDISEDDADAEGVLACDGMFDDADYCRIAKEIGSAIGDLKPCFIQLWQSIYGPNSWSLNPWVWVIEFKVIQVGGE